MKKIKLFYEQIPLPECTDCSYRLSKLYEEQDRETFGPRTASSNPLSLEKACKKGICLLETGKD